MKTSAAISLQILFLSAGSLLGCQNYSDQLQRAQSYYERNQYEMALSVVRNLEADQDSLSQSEAVRYCYVRGMTDYRLGYNSDARYWLGLAKAAYEKAPGSLDEDEMERLNESLDELNGPIFGIDDESEGADESAEVESSSSASIAAPKPVGDSVSSLQ